MAEIDTTSDELVADSRPGCGSLFVGGVAGSLLASGAHFGLWFGGSWLIDDVRTLSLLVLVVETALAGGAIVALRSPRGRTALDFASMLGFAIAIGVLSLLSAMCTWSMASSQFG
jgi:hypothetical protein